MLHQAALTHTACRLAMPACGDSPEDRSRRLGEFESRDNPFDPGSLMDPPPDAP